MHLTNFSVWCPCQIFLSFVHSDLFYSFLLSFLFLCYLSSPGLATQMPIDCMFVGERLWTRTLDRYTRTGLSECVVSRMSISFFHSFFLSFTVVNAPLLKTYTPGFTTQMPVGQMPVGGAIDCGPENWTGTQGRATLNVWSAQDRTGKRHTQPHWPRRVSNHGRLARWIKWRACDVGEAK